MFGEFNEMILYHAVLVKMLLGLLFIGLITPFLSLDCIKTIKRKRIYIFTLHGMLSTVAFGGLVAMIFAKIPFNISMGVMIIAYIVVSLLESIKHIKIVRSCFDKEECIQRIRTLTIKYTLVSIAIISALVAWKVME